MRQNLRSTQREVPHEGSRFSKKVLQFIYHTRAVNHIHSPSAVHHVHALSLSNDGLCTSTDSSRSKSPSSVCKRKREMMQSTTLSRNHGFPQSSCSLRTSRHLLRCITAIAVQQRSYRNTPESSSSHSKISQTQDGSLHYLW